MRLRLEIRAAQLNAACNLELWQLAFESAEELYAVLMHPSNKKAQKSEMMLNYYDKISQVLLLKRPPCLCVSLFKYSAASEELSSLRLTVIDRVGK